MWPKLISTFTTPKILRIPKRISYREERLKMMWGARGLAMAITILMIPSSSPFFGFETDVGHPFPEERSISNGIIEDVAIEWWFDPVSEAVCWDGRILLSEKFRIDFDGDRNTSVASMYVGVPAPYAVSPRSRMYQGSSAIPGLSGQISWLAEDLVNPPVPHHRSYSPVHDVYSEWYHVFVTKLDPPTDYILGVQRSDGENIIPLTDPFWFSENGGGSWHLFDPSVDSKGDRACREAFPEKVIVPHLDIDPDTLNLRSKGRWITAYLSTENASVYDINISSILLQDTLTPERWDYQGDILMLKFNRQELLSLLQVGDSIEIKIGGKWKDGSSFEAYDYIRVINPGKQ